VVTCVVGSVAPWVVGAVVPCLVGSDESGVVDEAVT
jgi:hypothetical protein